MKLKANRAMEYGHKVLKAGDLFDADSDFDAQILTTVPPGALNVVPPASLVEDENGEEENSSRSDSSTNKDTKTQAAKTTRGRSRTRKKTEDDHKVGVSSRRFYGRRDMEAEKAKEISPDEEDE